MERLRRAFNELSSRNVTEVIRGQVGEQRESHIGRRSPMRDHGNGMFLIVVRRKPMILRTDELLEERPGLSGKLPEKDSLVSRQISFAPSDRLADPPRDRRGSTPEAQDRQR